jgi:hypothetical protein
MKPSAVKDIMASLQRLLIDHMAADWPLTANLSPGQNIVSVLQSSRFREGDDVFLKSDVTGKAEAATINSVLPWDPILGYRIVLDDPVQGTWTVANSSSLLRAINHQPLKRVYKGSLTISPDYPSISISLPDESNDWLTIRATEHEYTFKIRAHVMADNFERGTELIANFAEAIREVLIDHIHPVVDNPPVIIPITTDVPANSSVIELTDTSRISPGNRVFLRDGEKRPAGSQEAVVQSILSSTQIRLATPTEWDYLVARGAELIVAVRYLYDTRPSSISYGYVPGGTGSFSHSAEISYFAKEMICRTGNLIT